MRIAVRHHFRPPAGRRLEGRSIGAALAAAGALLLAGACTRVDPASLPAVPQVQTTSFPAAVQEQLDAAYAELEAKPTNVRHNGRLAMMLQTYRQFPVAEIMYRRTRALAPDTFRWAYLHGLTLSAVGDLDGAESAFARAIELDGDFPLARVRRAEILSDLGRTDEAGAIFSRVMPEVQDLSEARFAYGRFLIAQGQHRAAIPEIRAAMRLSGPFGAAHYQLAIAYRALGEADVADRNFRLAEELRLQPADGSDPYLNELLPLNRNEQPFVQRAKVLAEAGRLDEARQFIELALERNPQSLPAHVSLMGLATQLGDFELMERHRAAAAAIDEASPRYWYALGIARLAQERPADAESSLIRAGELDPTDPNVPVQLAIVGSALGHADTEREPLLRSALAIDPDHQTANWLLGELLSGSRRAAESLDHFSRALDRDHPGRARMLVEYARALARTGDGAAAIAALDEAVAIGRDRGDEAAIAAAGRLRPVVEERLAPGSGEDASD